jgi:hypothetical protein
MPTARLLVVGIANTMDLPERLLPKIKSRASLDRVDFAPYTREQIVAILRARLQSLPVFTDDALELCARQVTSVSGDIRRALQLCRRAIELRQSQSQSSAARASPATVPGGAASSSGSRELLVLDAQDISKAAVSIRSSHHFKLMREGVYFERVALTALVRACEGAASHRGSVMGIGCITAFSSLLCAVLPLPGPSAASPRHGHRGVPRGGEALPNHRAGPRQGAPVPARGLDPARLPAPVRVRARGGVAPVGVPVPDVHAGRASGGRAVRAGERRGQAVRIPQGAKCRPAVLNCAGATAAHIGAGVRESVFACVRARACVVPNIFLFIRLAASTARVLSRTRVVLSESIPPDHVPTAGAVHGFSSAAVQGSTFCFKVPRASCCSPHVFGHAHLVHTVALLQRRLELLPQELDGFHVHLQCGGGTQKRQRCVQIAERRSHRKKAARPSACTR